MKYALVLPSGFLCRMQRYLFDPNGHEYSCYICAGAAQQGQRVKLLGRRLILPDKKLDYEFTSSASCKPNLFFLETVLFDAPKENDLIRTNLSIIDIHSHPFSHGDHVAFSSTDDEWQRGSAEYFFKVRKYQGFYCYLVFGSGGAFDGRVWYLDERNDKLTYRSLDEIIVLDYPYRRWMNVNRKTTARLSSASTHMLDRQILAFGKEGQIMLSGITAVIVGVGGLGSILAEGLARLGVSRFILVDMDDAEISNLNRFMGMTFSDAKSQISKVAIIMREILNINPNAEVEPIHDSVLKPEVLQRIKMADIVVLSTDNLRSRACTHELCLQYGIPLFSTGTVINADPKTGRIQDLVGEYQVVIPGQDGGCLYCTQTLDSREVSYLLSATEVQQEGQARGYVNLPGFHQPAVRPLNGAVADMALSEIHNYFCGFKEEMIEGMIYDQKRNLLHRREFCRKTFDQNINGEWVEGWVRPGEIQLTINGQEYCHETWDRNFPGPEEITAPGQPCSDFPQNILQTLLCPLIRRNWDDKKNCPHCGEKGIVGRGDNEPMTDYS